MRLCDLTHGLADRLCGDVDAPTEITDLSEDSRLVGPGALFIARGGSRTHGGRFLAEAVARGAGAILTDLRTKTPAGLPTIRTDDVAEAAAFLAEQYFGAPSMKLALIGITGTNGKTTTAHLTQQILMQSGRRAGLLGTVCVDDGLERTPASLTTPGAIEISRSLSRMVANGCSACVMEVSSHALEQQRVDALAFDVAVFTNLTGDHLDYHGTMDSYESAKARLFARLGSSGLAVVNMDDPRWRRMVAGCCARIVRCSLEQAHAEAKVAGEAMSVAGAAVALDGLFGSVKGRTKLLGTHNLMNLLEAVTAAWGAGVEVVGLGDRLAELSPPPGRLEPVIAAEAPGPAVLVDYAHTDDAIANAILAVRPIVPSGGRLWIVFGCGGDRDASKRPRMGAIASELADVVVVTSDNPRTENPDAILDAILTGIPATARGGVRVEADRARAIALAIEAADEKDVVLIAGKGHEVSQIVSDGAGGMIRREFDDRVVAARILTRRGGRARTPATGSGSHCGVFRGETAWQLGDLPAVVGGAWAVPAPEARQQQRITGFSMDSRTVAPGEVFFALTGQRHDGRDSIDPAIDAGAACAIAERDPARRYRHGERVLLVDDVSRAMARIASAHRDTLRGATVVGVTGSNGKTTTCRLIDAALSGARRGVRSRRSFNNHLGLPMTILQARPGDDFLVAELGMNAPGEIDCLASILRPDIAVITSVGRAHAGGLGSIEAITREKFSITRHVTPGGTVFVSGDVWRSLGAGDARPLSLARFDRNANRKDEPRRPVMRDAGGASSSVGPGDSSALIEPFFEDFLRDEDVRIESTSHETIDGKTMLCVELAEGSIFFAPVLGRHNAVNVAIAVGVARRLGVEDEVILAGLKRVAPPPMRLERASMAGVDVFNDAYNANPESMCAAIETFLELTDGADDPHKAPVRRILVLGDMLELGEVSGACHDELLRWICAEPRLGLSALGGGHPELVSSGRAMSLPGPGATATALAPPACGSSFDRRREGAVDSPRAVIMLVGPAMAESAARVRAGSRFVVAPAADDETMNRLASFFRPGDSVLFKGSRRLRLERALPRGASVP